MTNKDYPNPVLGDLIEGIVFLIAWPLQTAYDLYCLVTTPLAKKAIDGLGEQSAKAIEAFFRFH